MKLSGITPDEYRERVLRACDLLAGQSRDMLAQLEEEMKAAAAALDFERAAEMRNMLEDLRKTTKPMHRYTRSFGHRLGGGIDPLADIAALAESLQLGKPVHRMECFDISNISTTHIVASMVCFIDGRPAPQLYRRFRIRTVKGQDDFASMAEVVRRRYSRILREAGENAQNQKPAEPDGSKVDYSPEFSQEEPAEAVPRSATQSGSLPDLIIVDGGKGQLSAACRELRKMRLHNVPIIGLAKEFEEIHRPGQALPMLLPADSGALRLLQRIRDEAHRIANSYHQLLMKRRMGESILDDCPRVSSTRKQLLLQRFGSVTRLRRATAAQIATVEGIGPKLAEQIVTYLAERG
jgi:excinuclease ABC subunit C